MQSNNSTELEFEFSLKPSDNEEFSHILIDFKGKALMWDEHADEQVVAQLSGHRLDLASARHSHADMQLLFDSISPEISDLGSHIISNNNCYTECCSSDEPEKTPCGSLVYINELVVDKAWRNKQIGSEMLKRMSQIIDMNKTLVALKAYPITDDDSQARSAEQKKKLKHFYYKLGFRHSGDHYMVKDARYCHAQQVRALPHENVSQG
jgi:GNAT superfamily N-acetyltransferase